MKFFFFLVIRDGLIYLVKYMGKHHIIQDTLISCILANSNSFVEDSFPRPPIPCLIPLERVMLGIKFPFHTIL